jgi:nucleoside-diphosphate-sugar epimerase
VSEALVVSIVFVDPIHCGMFLNTHCNRFGCSDDSVKVIVVDVVVPPVRHPRVEYVRASITNMDHLLGAFRGAQSVIHVASLIPNVKMRKSKAVEIVNVDGTKAVIEACQQLG